MRWFHLSPKLLFAVWNLQNVTLNFFTIFFTWLCCFCGKVCFGVFFFKNYSLTTHFFFRFVWCLRFIWCFAHLYIIMFCIHNIAFWPNMQRKRLSSSLIGIFKTPSDNKYKSFRQNFPHSASEKYRNTRRISALYLSRLRKILPENAPTKTNFGLITKQIL